MGEWLPEPVLTSSDMTEDVELAESVSIAMLTVLETLGPMERAVFVLHEVFEMPYNEIAEAVGKSPVAVRHHSAHPIGLPSDLPPSTVSMTEWRGTTRWGSVSVLGANGLGVRST